MESGKSSSNADLNNSILFDVYSDSDCTQLNDAAYEISHEINNSVKS